MTNTRRPDVAFIGTAALVFVASAVVTIAWCSSMAAMPGMEMPGGWTMSMTWMRMPGQSGSGAAAMFLGMWTVMMVAMMLPVLVPMLLSYRAALTSTGNTRLAWPTTLAGAGYFTVWMLAGVAVFPLGVGLSEIAMRVPAASRAVPAAAGLVMVLAGGFQFTAWKKRQLACCRAAPLGMLPAGSGIALRHGLQLGLLCLRCCSGLTVVLLVIGVMDLRAMALVTLAIAAERLAPSGERVARGIGAVILAVGLYILVREPALSVV